MKNKLTIESFKYNEASKTNKADIKSLIQKIWYSDKDKDIHLKEHDAMSFCTYLDNQIVGYAGVIFQNIETQNNTYKLAALSCVCTHPEYKKSGIGTLTLQAATNWTINKSQSDIGLFTCSHNHVDFYERSGIWQQDPSLIIKGNSSENTLSSNHLKLAVIKTLISEKAKSNAGDFENKTIVLNLPDARFI